MTFKKMTPADIAATNQVRVRRAPLSFDMSGEALTFTDVDFVAGGRRVDTDAVLIEASLAGNTALLALPRQLFIALDVTSFLAEQQPKAAALLLEDAFHDLVERLEQCFGAPISFLACRTGDADEAEMLIAAFEAGGFYEIWIEDPSGTPLPVLVSLDGGVRTTFLNLVDQIPRARQQIKNAADLRLNCKVVLCAFDIALADLRTLQPSDVILVPELGANKGDLLQKTCVFRVGNFDLPAKLNDHGKTVTILETQSSSGDLLMQSDNEVGDDGAAHYEEHDNPVPFSDVAVTLSFEMARKQMPLKSLQQIAPGYVFDLQSDIASPIDIRVNGQLIGKGEIVEVCDALGVRVLMIETEPDATGRDQASREDGTPDNG
ncbi:MAG: FliM/FliN family flagellar motor switch protein [Pseudomonadota bacterium]